MYLWRWFTIQWIFSSPSDIKKTPPETEMNGWWWNVIFGCFFFSMILFESQFFCFHTPKSIKRNKHFEFANTQKLLLENFFREAKKKRKNTKIAVKNLAKKNRNVNKLFATLNAVADEYCFGWQSKGSQEHTTILYLPHHRCYSIEWKRSKTDTYMFILLSCYRKTVPNPNPNRMPLLHEVVQCIVWPCNTGKSKLCRERERDSE